MARGCVGAAGAWRVSRSHLSSELLGAGVRGYYGNASPPPPCRLCRPLTLPQGPALVHSADDDSLAMRVGNMHQLHVVRGE